MPSGPPPKSTGAALVLGGGVAGIQCSLDLAEGGYKVYLVEKAPALGGHMAQLDKTFPTNDCSMCTLAPKLVEAGRHLNIEIVTNSELVGLEGEPGDFKAKVFHHARFVDPDKCTSCGECVPVCPVVVPDPYNEGLGERKAIYKLYPQAIPNTYAVTKKGHSPCKRACAVATSAQGYVALIREGRFAEAYTVASEPNPFPAVCGRVCTAQCEVDCTRGEVEEPIAIRSLKRFVTDFANENVPLPEKAEVTFDEKVAVIGAGPSGLTAARDLALLGYQTTVFESKAEPGGMLRFGIPEYRLPKAALQQDVDRILALGVDLRVRQALRHRRHRRRPARRRLQGRLPGRRPAGRPHAADPRRRRAERARRRQPALQGDRRRAGRDGQEGRRHRRRRRRLRRRPHRPAPRRRAGRHQLHRGRRHGAGLRRGGRRGARREHPLQLLVHARRHQARRRRPRLRRHLQLVLARRARRARLAAAGPARRHRARPRLRHGHLRHRPEHGRRLPPGRERHRGRARPDRHRQADATPRAAPACSPAATPRRARRGRRSRRSPPAGARRAASTTTCAARSSCRSGTTAWTRPSPTTRRSPRPRSWRACRCRSSPGAARKVTWDEVNTGFTEEQAVAEAKRCLDCAICSECFECVRACGPGALLHDERDEEFEVEVGAVVMATGFDLHDPGKASEYGYRRYPNVLSALEYERMLSASGPTMGDVKRPSDGEHPTRIAFIQCVGSRDQEHEYCSSVCCMFANKQAMLTIDHVPEAKPEVFLMDMRAQGKGFDAFYQRAQERGVSFIRSRPSTIKEDPLTKDLLIDWEDEQGKMQTERVRHGRALGRPRACAQGAGGGRPPRHRAQPPRLLQARGVRAPGDEPRGRLRRRAVRRAQGHPRLGRPGLGRGGPGDDRPRRLARHAHGREGVPGRARHRRRGRRASASSSATAARTSPA